jgi:hypothetical protein
MDIWTFQRRISRRLLAINIVNMILGTWAASRRGIMRGIGMQAVGWGLINIAIAVFGDITTRQRYRELENPDAPEVIKNETRKLQRILLINTPLNWVYMGSGLFIARRSQKHRDSGIGIIIQGAILFVFDLTHLRRITALQSQSSDL